MNSSSKVKLIDFGAAQKLKHPQQTMDRLPGNLAAVSPERAAKLPYRYLEEDCCKGLAGLSIASSNNCPMTPQQAGSCAQGSNHCWSGQQVGPTCRPPCGAWAFK